MLGKRKQKKGTRDGRKTPALDIKFLVTVLYCILYSFIVQVDRMQLVLHTGSFAYMVYP